MEPLCYNIETYQNPSRKVSGGVTIYRSGGWSWTGRCRTLDEAVRMATEQSKGDVMTRVTRVSEYDNDKEVKRFHNGLVMPESLPCYGLPF